MVWEPTQERWIELESQLAFQEDLLQALNDALVKQQKQIEQLEVQVRSLGGKLAQLEDARGSDPNKQEIPPHY